MKDFEELNLSERLSNALKKMDYTKPTPIQAEAIPLALEGHDILGSAQTGTGKTAAFAIPLIEHLVKNESSNAMIITPTRELAKQIRDLLKDLLGEKSKIRMAFLIGGDPIHLQFKQLKNRPRLFIGTPGRICDHIKRNSLHLDRTDFLVLDETDRMLDMGFSKDIEAIVDQMPEQRQTLLFSATLPKNIMQLVQKYQNDPKRVAVGTLNDPAKNIEQHLIRVNSNDEKYAILDKELDARDGTVIVFVKTKHGADKLAKKLSQSGHESVAIHGDLRQSRRERVIRDYRAQKFRILVATDVVARGLDVPHVAHVINYDVPMMPEDYIHRIGRTARAGKSGHALNLITSADSRKWFAIECLLDPEKAKSAAGEGRKGGAGKPRRKLERNRGSAGRGRGRSEGRPERSFDRDRSEHPAERRKRSKNGGESRRDGAELAGEFKPQRSKSEGGFKKSSRSEAFKQERAGSGKRDFKKRDFSDRSEGFSGEREGRRSEGGFKKSSRSESFKQGRDGAGKRDFKKRDFSDRSESFDGERGGEERPRFKKKSPVSTAPFKGKKKPAGRSFDGDAPMKRKSKTGKVNKNKGKPAAHKKRERA